MRHFTDGVTVRVRRPKRDSESEAVRAGTRARRQDAIFEDPRPYSSDIADWLRHFPAPILSCCDSKPAPLTRLERKKSRPSCSTAAPPAGT